jgi:hypothetical protein
MGLRRSIKLLPNVRIARRARCPCHDAARSQDASDRWFAGDRFELHRMRRAAQGLGASMLNPVALSIIANAFREK